MNLYRIAFGSSIGHCKELRGWVKSIGRIEGYSDEFLSLLELSVHEAFVNAVVHGNKDRPCLPVSIVFHCRQSISGRSLRVQVRDCGKGFDINEIHGQYVNKGYDVQGGRGMTIIRHYADSLDIETSSEGSVITLHYIPF